MLPIHKAIYWALNFICNNKLRPSFWRSSIEQSSNELMNPDPSTKLGMYDMFGGLLLQKSTSFISIRIRIHVCDIYLNEWLICMVSM